MGTGDGWDRRTDERDGDDPVEECAEVSTECCTAREEEARDLFMEIKKGPTSIGT